MASIDDQRLRTYLLTGAAGADDEEISLGLIGSDDLDDRLKRAEAELVEDYIEGSLTFEEREQFVQNFLISADRRALLSELRLLRTGAARLNTPARKEQRRPARAKFFAGFGRPLFAAFGLLLLLTGGFAVWYGFIRDGRSPLEIEYAALNRRDLGDPARIAGLSSISLAPGNLRDANSTARHAAPGLTETVVFRLALPVPEPEGAEREVTITKAGRHLFGVSGRVFRSAYGSELRFLAPKEALPGGSLEIEVSLTDGRKSVYQLRID